MSSSKRSTAYVAAIGLLGVAVLAISVVTLIKVYSNEAPAVVDGKEPSKQSSGGQAYNELNVPAPPVLSPKNDAKYKAFSEFAQQLRGSVNPGVNPCEDFYAYTCGSQPNKSLSYVDLNVQNFRLVAQQLAKQDYVNEFQTPKPVKQSAIFHSKCVDALKNWASKVVDGQRVLTKVNAFRKLVGVSFPALNTSEKLTEFPSAHVLGSALGYLSYTEGLNTLLSFSIETNWKDPHGKQPYALYIDQTELPYPDVYYLKLWDDIKANYFTEINDIFTSFAKYNNSQVDQAILKEDVNKIMDLEWKIATQVNTPPALRRSFDRSYNLFDVTSATVKFKSIDFFELVHQAVHHTPQKHYQFIVKEPEALTRLLNLLTSKQVEPRTVYNYLFYRLLRKNAGYLPGQTGPTAYLKVEPALFAADKHLGRMGGNMNKRRRGSFLENTDWAYGWYPDKSIDDWSSIACAAENSYTMAAANSRVYLDAAYPDEDRRMQLRDGVGKIVANVADAFQGMITQLDWMTTGSKVNAYAKLHHLVKNIGYPDFITNDTALAAYYNQAHAKLIFDQSHNFTTIVDAIANFQRDLEIDSLISPIDTDRLRFGWPAYSAISIADAWYMADINALSLPLGFIQKPFYNSDYPTAVNFGALGSVVGHELVHGFDDQGIQWDGTGVLNNWMDNQSQQGFDKMAKCVAKQYNSFPAMQGMKVDGKLTLAENMADNGGIQAAFRAFQSYRSLYGSDPQLPDPVFQAFNQDQLFFLSYAQQWCSKPIETGFQKRQLLVDTHSPYQYRVFGTMQNFPAFKSAFNCPAKSVYAPETHCNVWTSDSKQVSGVPRTTTMLPPLNIPPMVPSSSDKYMKAAAYFEYSVDNTKDPCNNFYEYACGNYEDAMSFEYADAYTLEAMIYGLKKPIEEDEIMPIQKVKQLYNQCKKDLSRWSQLISDGAVINRAVKELEAYSMFPFPLFSKKSKFVWPSSYHLGTALGFLSGHLQTDTLLSSYIDTNWVEPQNNGVPYQLYVDQAVLGLPRVYYVGKTWDLIKDNYSQRVTSLLLRYARISSYPMNRKALEADVKDILQFEYVIANNLMTDDSTRRNFKRSYNPISLNNKTAVNAFKFVNLEYYLRALTGKYLPKQQFLEEVVLMEPALFSLYNEVFVEENSYNFTARTLYNYLHYRLIMTNSMYLPHLLENRVVSGRKAAKPQEAKFDHRFYDKRTAEKTDNPKEVDAEALLDRYEYDRPAIGRPKFTKKKYPKPEQLKRLKKKQDNEVDEFELSDYTCAVETLYQMPYANARVFIDQAYPDQNRRDYIQKSAGELISNVVTSFKSMVDQLSWMSWDSKQSAYNKIQNLVKNIAWPDFITKDDQLSIYYSRLEFSQPYTFIDMLSNLTQFEYQKAYDLLLSTGNADRTDFNGPPAVTNAWYQPQLNSITFPASILQMPFFDPEWPDSINYGGLGVIAGHELTHGFDDEGVQWNGMGALRDWLDAPSKKGFLKMADCVVKEYDKFCPLDSDYYQPSCVNGVNTQGENIADNGGIRAAYRAYRNSLNLKGPNPSLPGTLSSQFTHDQLFFLNFAQVWCEPAPKSSNTFTQLLLDPHSPSKYRVWGTVENFPAFRAAFNCPANQAYTPEEHCNVWVDEVKSVTGVPPTTTTLPPLNIPKLQQSSIKKYAEAASYFAKSVDTKKNPCDNFYEYTCGNFKASSHFEHAQIMSTLKNRVALLNAIKKQKEDSTANMPSSLLKATNLYSSCLSALPQWDTFSNLSIGKFLRGFNRNTEFPFPLVNHQDKYHWPESSHLGFALGYLRGKLGLDVLLNTFVDTTWTSPQSQKPYSLYLDQPNLMLPREYYLGNAWELIKNYYIYDIADILDTYTSNAGGVKPDSQELLQTAASVATFEQTLAVEFMSDDNTRRNYSRQYNPINFIDLLEQTEFANLGYYYLYSMIFADSIETAYRMFGGRNEKVVVMEPTKFKKFERAFKNHNKYQFTAKQLYNYIYVRILHSFYGVSDSLGMRRVNSIIPLKTFVRPPVGRPKWEERVQIHLFLQDQQARQKSFEELRSLINSSYLPNHQQSHPNPTLQAEFICASFVMFSVPYSTTRHYLDFFHPNKESRSQFRKGIDSVVEGVLDGFGSMVNQLDWMSASTKKGAQDKILNLARNLGWPDFLTNDTALDSYYQDLEVDANNFGENLMDLRHFDLKLQWKYLSVVGGTQREDFNGPPGIVNAWYQPELNSITLPLGILQQPFYDADWPASVNFGAMGVVIGHELTHGFDDQGVQFDDVGTMRRWMDDSSLASFNKMAQCVIEEYSGMCPLSQNEYQPNCINGFQTQGENIADNGGIRAAFRAYRNAINFNGDDMALPDNLVGQFTHDQLFFLSFGQVWCQEETSPVSNYMRLLVDPHSPPENRVWGTLQNFPAFKNAFNCPVDSAYAPEKHCNVWASEAKQVTGLPATTTTLPDLNVPQKQRSSSLKYQEAAEYFERSVDNTQSPCDNFYEYACNNYPEHNDLDNFVKIDYQNIEQLAKAYRADDGEEIAPLEQAKLLFRQCEDMSVHGNDILKQLDLPRQKYYQFQRNTKISHPAFSGDAPTDWMDAKTLAKTLGVLDGQLHTSTLISSFVMTNAKDPGGEQPYALYVDQSFLSLPDFVFEDSFMWYRLVDRIGFIAQIVMQIYADYLGVDYDYNDVDNAAQDIVDFEYAIANNFMTDDNTRRYFDRNYNWMSAKEASKKFSFFDFQTYFSELAFDAESAVKQMMQKEDFNFVLMEPVQLSKLGQAMTNGNEFGFTPNQLLNYLYFRVMRDNINNVPMRDDESVKVVSENVLGYKLYHPRLGRPLYLKVDKYEKEDDPVSNEELNCAIQVLFNMDMASSRVYLDHAFPQPKRDRVRRGAQIVLNSILLGFRSMVEQISWMSPSAKQGAFDKMDNIVTNVAYPDFITNNTQLETYYEDLHFDEQDSFVSSMDKIIQFLYKQQFGYLLKKSVMRDEFGSSNVLVNAWYQPQVNSITLPAAILQPPFFDPDWPAAVNFGSLGVVVGHELTHGFDDQGVQWDGVGVLNGWLDASSRQAFDQMAKCIVNEYNGFCPLDPDEYQPNCLNGFNTQGENIADNGGIHAAFRAYRNSLEVNGPDRALPSDLVGQFTHDQLFFLSFTQPWCMDQQDPEETYSQIIFDPHSPAKYRILGTLRNFPAFRDAFNCPVNSVYAPEKHCEVWVTDISSKPLPSLPPNQINVAVPKAVKADDKEFSTYRNAFNYFKASVNFSYNPCENFYEYACGSYKNELSFTFSRNENYRKLANALESLQSTPSSAVQKLKDFYDMCTVTYNDLYSDAENSSGADYLKDIIREKVNMFSETTQLQMTIFDKIRPVDTPLPDGDTLATAMAYLSIKEGIDTLVTPFVDVELVKTNGPKGYKLFLDQNTLVYPKSYYQPGAWELQQPKYFANAMEMLKRFAEVMQKEVDEKELSSYVNKLMALEVMLARAPYSTGDALRRNFSRWDNLKSLQEANQDYGFVNWMTYFDKISNYTDLAAIKPASLSTYTAYFTEHDTVKQLSKDLSDAAKFDRNLLINYFFFRLLTQNSKFIPKSKSSSNYVKIVQSSGFDLGTQKYLRRDRSRPDPFDGDNEQARMSCARQTMDKMTFANARVFTELLYPTQEARENIKKATSKLVQSIRHSYRGIMDELDWLDDSSRKGAFAKVDDMQINLAYPDFVMDNELLDKSYETLSISIEKDTYYTALQKLTVYNRQQEYKQLLGGVDRSYFVGPPSTVNAWYAPEFNSITFPEGILREPWFNPDWPASINYGGLGAVAGHEISHAFDDGGVQWNSLGGLNSWMSESSQQSFQKMAECVVEEYSGFQVLNATEYTPNKINGNNTQGENIADNAGIHASFRAYRNHIALNGPDPQLPDRTFRQLTHDQLFFLSFAQKWCQAPPSDEQLLQQILVDPHSPSYLRVLGTVQNYPAFRSAFNCPVGSVYAPKQHCHVWTPVN